MYRLAYHACFARHFLGKPTSEDRERVRINRFRLQLPYANTPFLFRKRQRRREEHSKTGSIAVLVREFRTDNLCPYQHSRRAGGSRKQ